LRVIRKLISYRRKKVNLVSIVRFLAALSWLAVFVAIAVVIMRAARGTPMKSGNAIVIVVALIAVLLNVAGAGLIFVQPDERGVVVTIASGGVRPEPLQPGLNWVIPYADSVVPYSIARNTYTMSIAPQEGQVVGDDSVEARTLDGQIVLVDASVIFSLNPSKVVDVHITWQDRYIDGLVRPFARGAIRDAVALFRIDEVYSTKRAELSTIIAEVLIPEFSDNGIIMVDFVLRNIAFSDEYSASVEQKQIAEQLAEQAIFVVQQAQEEANQAREVAQGLADAVVIRASGSAEARLIEASAEAEALELLGAALSSNPDVITLQYIEKLSPGIQVMLVPNDNPFLLPLPSVTGP
jgi:regulator of protease activity HflC (stomatin/prohibitin superfamily)